MNVLIFLPCLNEEKTLAAVIDSLPRDLPGVDKISILVIDDGSSDNSAKIAAEHGATVISNGTNLGLGITFQRAVNFALNNNHHIMVNMDADGQFNPNDISRLIKPIVENKADFVTASRFLNSDIKIENMSKIKKWGNKKMSQLINRLARTQFSDVSCGFRAYSQEALLHLNLQGTFTYTQETFLNLVYHNMRIAEIPVEVRYFEGRVSRVAHSILSYAINTSKIIFRTYRDYQPFVFFMYLATAFFAVGAAFLSFFFYWRFTSGKFSPHIWTGFIGGFFMFPALLFFSLAILADMFVRIRKNQEDIIYRMKKMSINTFK